MEVTGKILKVGETQEFGSNGFKKRQVVVNEVIEIQDKKYDNPVLIEFVQKNCDKLDGFSVGDEVTVDINIRGREYKKDGETKYFTSVQGWRVQSVEGNTQASPVEAEQEDLPF